MKTYEQFNESVLQAVKNRMKRGAINPFGQKEVRSGAEGRKRVPVFTGRTNKGPRQDRKAFATTDQQTANTYTNPGPITGAPGTGKKPNPKGTVDKGTLPQRYIDKYGSRSVLGQKQIKMSPSAARKVFTDMIPRGKGQHYSKK